jgi:hypothetical protein
MTTARQQPPMMTRVLAGQMGYEGCRRRPGGCRCSSAEDYHQQYLHKVPNGYCPDHGTGVACPVGLIRADG